MSAELAELMMFFRFYILYLWKCLFLGKYARQCLFSIKSILLLLIKKSLFSFSNFHIYDQTAAMSKN